MRCPNCSKPMVILELNSVEIDYCFQCKGIWLDGGELEILLDGLPHKEKLLSSFTVDHACPEKKLKCPICSSKMVKVSRAGTSESTILDKCAQNCGLWFDYGELEVIIRDGGRDSEQGSKVYSLLKDMFSNSQKIGGL